MRRRIVAGNWKMNGSKDLAKSLVGDVRSEAGSLANGVEVVIIPPALYVADVASLAAADLKVGVQNVSQWSSGAYTGEVSAEMAADLGCQYVLAGHSERRQLFGETDDVVARKVERILACGLFAMVCVGETLEERDAGDAEAVVAAQVRKALADVESTQWERVVVAYEPVWAIGTGRTATPEQVSAVHQQIRRFFARSAPEAAEDISETVRIVYGGSVKAGNAYELFSLSDVDGGLIGGASLHADEFGTIAGALAEASGVLEGECETD